jgi:hypothetical protein
MCCVFIHAYTVHRIASQAAGAMRPHVFRQQALRHVRVGCFDGDGVHFVESTVTIWSVIRRAQHNLAGEWAGGCVHGSVVDRCGHMNINVREQRMLNTNPFTPHS